MDSIIWRGPSRVDGAPLVAVVTGFKHPSKNSKTGPMLQVYVLREDVHPVAAVRRSSDRSICGDCALRPANMNTCYVVTGNGPGSVFLALTAGKYPVLPVSRFAGVFRGRDVRYTAYGDPAVVDPSLGLMLTRSARTVLAYTHHWNSPWCDPSLKQYAMASCESVSQAEQAKAAGWGYFRVRGLGDPTLPGEAQCPHKATGLQCISCGHCDGLARPSVKGNVTEVVHGTRAKYFMMAPGGDVVDLAERNRRLERNRKGQG